MVGSKLAGVSRVISLRTSSSVYPTASFAAILAIGIRLPWRPGPRSVRHGGSSRYLAHRRHIHSAQHDFLELFPVIRDSPAGSPQGVGRADNQWETADLGRNLPRFLDLVGHSRERHIQPDPLHGFFEQKTVFPL